MAAGSSSISHNWLSSDFVSVTEGKKEPPSSTAVNIPQYKEYDNTVIIIHSSAAVKHLVNDEASSHECLQMCQREVRNKHIDTCISNQQQPTVSLTAHVVTPSFYALKLDTVINFTDKLEECLIY